MHDAHVNKILFVHLSLICLWPVSFRGPPPSGELKMGRGKVEENIIFLPYSSLILYFFLSLFPILEQEAVSV